MTLKLFFFTAFIGLNAFCQAQDSTVHSGRFQEEAFLHSMDCITPYTLKKGEWIYAQSFQTLPFPSWAFVGLTDKVTMQIDLLPWIYGFFSEFGKPIPSLNARYRFNEQKDHLPTFGVEAMFVHFWDEFDRIETESIGIKENGSYFHVKPSAAYRFGNGWNINFSVGIDYIGEVIMENRNDDHGGQATFTNSWNPNTSLSLGWRPSPWISYHAGYSYGTTFTYFENIPRKHQVSYGFRFAPFHKGKRSFFRDLRIELISINVFFPDIEASQILPIPLYPYLYWQWRSKRSLRK